MTKWPEKKIVLLALVLVSVLVLAVILVQRHYSVRSQYTVPPLTPSPTLWPVPTSQLTQMSTTVPTMPQALHPVSAANQIMPATIGVAGASVDPNSVASTAVPVSSAYVMSDNDFQEYLAAWALVKGGGSDAYSNQWAKHVLTTLKDASLTPSQQTALRPDDQVSITAKALTLN